MAAHPSSEALRASEPSPRRPHRRPSGRPGFCNHEYLVVIAMAAIVLAVLVPMIARVHQQTTAKQATMGRVPGIGDHALTLGSAGLGTVVALTAFFVGLAVLSRLAEVLWDGLTRILAPEDSCFVPVLLLVPAGLLAVCLPLAVQARTPQYPGGAWWLSAGLDLLLLAGSVHALRGRWDASIASRLLLYLVIGIAVYGAGMLVCSA